MLIVNIILIFLLYLSNINASGSSQNERIKKENLFLKAEYGLAKEYKIYFVFNLEEKKILLKARGLTLKEYPIQSFKIWGYKILPQPLKLVKKGWIAKPARKKIIPVNNIDYSSELGFFDIFDINDLPSRYSLKFNEATWIFIRPKSNRISSHILNLLSCVKSYAIIKPFGSIMYTIMKKRFTEIEIYLDENDSKSLFWSLQEGYRCIIFTND